MPQYLWAEAYDPLEMLDHLCEPPAHDPASGREQHSELLNTYTVRCLVAIGADSEADVFREHAFGTSSGATDLEYRTEALVGRAGMRAGGGFSAGHRPRHMPVYAQRARAALAAINSLGGYDGSPWRAAVAVTRETRHLLQRRQCAWLRCLFPNPLAPVAVEREWLTSTVLDLATGISAENAFDRLPILADALQDAGCDNADLLRHCRHDADHGPHCWAVAAILELGRTCPG